MQATPGTADSNNLKNHLIFDYSSNGCITQNLAPVNVDKNLLNDFPQHLLRKSPPPVT